MVRLGKARPLSGHSSIGSIYTRKTLHPGVPPSTTESNKGGSVPVIWQTRHRAYLEYTQNIMLQHQSEDPTAELAERWTELSQVLDESRSFFRVHAGYFSNIPKCIKAEFIASWACSQSSVVSSSKR
ncbi:hypothetical protein TNCV_1770041 [Trichonephila clavipes]|nr:hypothetical protein TNCV_1770041 [Trichonephila clavipes]